MLYYVEVPNPGLRMSRSTHQVGWLQAEVIEVAHPTWASMEYMGLFPETLAQQTRRSDKVQSLKDRSIVGPYELHVGEVDQFAT